MIAVIALLSILTQFGSPVAAVAAPRPKPSPNPAPNPIYSPRFHIRPSQIRGKPMPSPKPKRPRVRGVHSKPKFVAPVVIAPKPTATSKPPVPPATFELSKSSKPGKLILKYKANIANLELDARVPFVIQLVPRGALKLTPSFFTRSDWPKNTAQGVELSYQGAIKNKDNYILGKAAFTVCVRQTKECRKQKVPIVFHFR